MFAFKDRATRVRLAVAFVVVALGITPVSPGTKEEIIRLQSDILRLEKQIQELQKTNVENGAVIKTLLEQLNDQVANQKVQLVTLSSATGESRADVKSTVAAVLAELRNLQVKLDDTNSRIAALSQKVEDTRVRVEQVNTGTALGNAGFGSLGPSGAGPSGEELYKTAYDDYILGSYDLAIQGFREYLKRFKDAEKADDAQYYIGMSLFDQRKFDEAVVGFDAVINLYPQGNKMPAARFKKGSALVQLKKPTEAIEEFQALVRDFPRSEEASLARQELDRMRPAPTGPRRRTPPG